MTLVNVPPWIDSWTDFRREYNKAIAEFIGMESIDSTGKGVDIAVVDTVYRSTKIDKNITVKGRQDFSSVGDHIQQEYSHGTRVLSILSKVAPSAGYYLYRVKTARKLIEENEYPQNQSVDPDPERLDGANKKILSAIKQAIEDDVDIINLSVGTYHPSCRNCIFEEAIEAAKKANIAVVAAIGNESDRRGDHVLCPALTDDVLSVGGVVNRCTANFESHIKDRRIWANVKTKDGQIKRQGPICSFNGCTPERECGANRDEQWWDGNIRPFGGNPHILAPVHLPERKSSQIVLSPEIISDEVVLSPETTATKVVLSPGTSFSTPLITGAIAQLLELYPERGIEQIIKAVREGGPKVQGPHNQSATRLDVAQSIKALNNKSEAQ